MGIQVLKYPYLVQSMLYESAKKYKVYELQTTSKLNFPV